MRYQFFTVCCGDPGSDSERLNTFLAAHPMVETMPPGRPPLARLPTLGRPRRPTQDDHAA